MQCTHRVQPFAALWMSAGVYPVAVHVFGRFLIHPGVGKEPWLCLFFFIFFFLLAEAGLILLSIVQV